MARAERRPRQMTAASPSPASRTMPPSAAPRPLAARARAGGRAATAGAARAVSWDRPRCSRARTAISSRTRPLAQVQPIGCSEREGSNPRQSGCGCGARPCAPRMKRATMGPRARWRAATRTPPRSAGGAARAGRRGAPGLDQQQHAQRCGDLRQDDEGDGDGEERKGRLAPEQRAMWRRDHQPQRRQPHAQQHQLRRDGCRWPATRRPAIAGATASRAGAARPSGAAAPVSRSNVAMVRLRGVRRPGWPPLTARIVASMASARMARARQRGARSRLPRGQHQDGANSQHHAEGEELASGGELQRRDEGAQRGRAQEETRPLYQRARLPAGRRRARAGDREQEGRATEQRAARSQRRRLQQGGVQRGRHRAPGGGPRGSRGLRRA